MKFQNVARLEDAQVILLGEIHDVMSQRVLNSMLIELLYQPQDIILVETAPELGSFSRQIASFVSGVNISGWDHPKRIEDTISFQKRFLQLIHLAENIDENNWLNWVGNVLRLYPQNIEMEEAYFQQQIELDFGHYTKDEKPMVAKALISSIAIEWIDYIISWVDDTLIVRNLHMVHQIEDHYFEGRKVFVTAGKGHFFTDKRNDPVHQEAIEKLHQGLRGMKFVILEPKESSVNQPAISTFDQLKRAWQKSHWKNRPKILAAGLGIGLVNLVALPLIGVSSLVKKLRPFTPSDLKYGEAQLSDLIEKYVKLGTEYSYYSFLMKFEDRICHKYNQVLSDDKRGCRNTFKEVEEKLKR